MVSALAKHHIATALLLGTLATLACASVVVNDSVRLIDEAENTPALLRHPARTGPSPAAAANAAPVSSLWQQSEFVVSFWVDPMVEPADFPARYQEVAEAHFTTVLGGFGATTADSIKAQVEAAHGVGLGVIASSNFQSGAPEPPYYSDNTSLLGFQIWDEPNAKSFPALATQVAKMRGEHPGKLNFINLLPNYAYPPQLGSPTYGDYVRDFVRTVNPDILSVDHYPTFRNDGPDPFVASVNNTKVGYRDNMAVLREVASENGNIPFWNFLNVMPIGNYSDPASDLYADPTEAQIRWQVYTSIAYGAKGVLYFCYWTPTGFDMGGGIITPAGNPEQMVRGPHYAHVQKINLALKSYGPYLMRATSVAVHHAVPENKASHSVAGQFAGSPLADLVDAAGAEWLVGQFSLPDGRTLLVVNNHLDASNAVPTLIWAPCADLTSLVEVSPTTGLEMAFVDDAPRQPGLQMALPAGTGRVLIVKTTGACA